MKKKLMIGSVIAIFLGVLAAPFMLGNARVEEGGRVTFSTSKTTGNKAKETTEKELADQKKAGGSKKPRTTEYRAFDNDHFQKNTTKTRLLFFKKPGDEVSDQVHTIFVTHINDFKKDIIIYHANIEESGDMAKDLGVSRPGTVLKFDKEASVTAIYIAPERPQLEQIRQILDI